jgi:hypothetical protein
MGPPADARGRLALVVAEVPHVELLARNIATLEHPQHRDQGFDLHVRETELVRGLEILCQHIALLSHLARK